MNDNNGSYGNNGDFYGNNGAGSGNYQGYNPYTPPTGGGNNRKKRGKGWLIAVLIVLAVIVVSTLSIGIYSFATGNSGNDSSAPIQLPQESAEPTQGSQPEQSSAPEDNASKEGTSEEYSLSLGSATGIDEMTPEQVSDKLIPSVVCIQNYQKVVYQSQGYGYGFGNGRSSETGAQTEEIELYGEGSGIILTSDGYIATNAHVVSDAELLKVVLSDDNIYEATLVGIDTDTDLAVIKINATGLTPAELGNSDDLKIGQYVMAIGNPGGLEFSSSVTLGIVSSIDRPLELEDGGYTMNTIQTDAAIKPGNSGGALVNLKGQVVGISSAKYVTTGYEGLGFAITINEALPIIEDLMDYGSVQGRSMLGITGLMLDSVTADYYGLKEGFYVYTVSNQNAGTLAAGDVITKINDIDITSDSNIKDAIKELTPGTSISLEYYRSSDQKAYSTQLVLVEYADSTD